MRKSSSPHTAVQSCSQRGELMIFLRFFDQWSNISGGMLRSYREGFHSHSFQVERSHVHRHDQAPVCLGLFTIQSEPETICEALERSRPLGLKFPSHFFPLRRLRASRNAPNAMWYGWLVTSFW